MTDTKTKKPSDQPGARTPIPLTPGTKQALERLKGSEAVAGTRHASAICSRILHNALVERPDLGAMLLMPSKAAVQSAITGGKTEG